MEKSNLKVLLLSVAFALALILEGIASPIASYAEDATNAAGEPMVDITSTIIVVD